MAENVNGLETTQEAPPASPPVQAILVIHGIGPQQPFQALDRFVNGLRDALRLDGLSVTTTHRFFRREEALDNSFMIEAFKREGETAYFRLDVHEFYWAPLVQGKASFAQVARWLLATGFTPVRRLAFNIPLVVRRGMDRSHQLLELGRELRRLLYVPLVAFGLVWLAASLVSQSSALAKQILDALAPMLPSLMTWSGGATAALALVAAIAAIGLGLSIPEQIGDLWELRKNGPPQDGVGRAASRAYDAEKNPFTGLLKGAMAGAKSLSDEASAQWHAELQARLWFLPLSLLALVVAVALVIWISLPSPPGAVFPAPVVHNFLSQLLKTELGIVILLLLIAFALKRVFVDYVADIALYTTANENSAFFVTRAALLREATSRVRYLLREEQYASVAIAGHSLGSVIAYDAITLLRTEAQFSRERDVREDEVALSHTVPITDKHFAKLTTLITFGSPLNKVLYFFRTRTKVYETFRRHILQEERGFRLLPDLLARDPIIEASGTTPIHDKVHWVNVFSPMDPISARLVFYRKIVERPRWYRIPGKCHVDYWQDRKFYRDVLIALIHTDASDEAFRAAFSS